LRPATLEALFEMLAVHPDALLIAGGTDLMVEVNQRYRRAPALVSLDALAELRGIHSSPSEWRLGAACTLTEIEHALYPSDAAPALLAQLWPLFSSRLIRNRATLGGNLATASPIGDSSPVLLALDARVRLVSRAAERSLPLEQFFVGYRQTALAPVEVIAEGCIPKPLPRFQRFYTVSKRPLDDISTVAAAFCLSLDAHGAVETLRAAFGGVAATPLRATQAEAAAHGLPWNAATQRLVADALGNLGTPLSDPRGSAAYRKAMIVSLFEQFCAETAAAVEVAQP
jgi:xanthine dehydrogenase small subunit